MFQKIIFVTVIYVENIFSVFAQSRDISIGSYKSVQSVVLNEERKFWLYLLPNHDPNRSYPVVYMMDGDRSFHYASGIIKQLAANGKMPETILVAIPNTDRLRDLSPT